MAVKLPCSQVSHVRSIYNNISAFIGRINQSNEGLQKLSSSQFQLSSCICNWHWIGKVLSLILKQDYCVDYRRELFLFSSQFAELISFVNNETTWYYQYYFCENIVWKNCSSATSDRGEITKFILVSTVTLKHFISPIMLPAWMSAFIFI